MEKRTLGRSGIEVSALGLGCAPIGGKLYYQGSTISWSGTSDDESLRALERALDLGLNFFDTGDVYGAGHSERLLGRAFKGRRDRVVIATKFGTCFDEERREITGSNAEPAYIREACDASLRRLDIDYIDLYQFHRADHPVERAEEVREVLEELVAAGKIRAYGWSTDDPVRAQIFAAGPRCAAVQMQLNVFDTNSETLALCEAENLAAVGRSPLANGLLTGKYTTETRFPEDDFRRTFNLREGACARQLAQVDALKDLLTLGGRTMTQGALAWCWARSPKAIPIPGFKSVAQVEENAEALRLGPLPPDTMAEIDRVLRDPLPMDF